VQSKAGRLQNYNSLSDTVIESLETFRTAVPAAQPDWTGAAENAGRLTTKKILLGNELFIRVRDDVNRILEGATYHWLHGRKTATFIQRHLRRHKQPFTEINNY